MGKQWGWFMHTLNGSSRSVLLVMGAAEYSYPILSLHESHVQHACWCVSAVRSINSHGLSAIHGTRMSSHLCLYCFVHIKMHLSRPVGYVLIVTCTESPSDCLLTPVYAVVRRALRLVATSTAMGREPATA